MFRALAFELRELDLGWMIMLRGALFLDRLLHITVDHRDGIRWHEQYRDRDDDRDPKCPTAANQTRHGEVGSR